MVWTDIARAEHNQDRLRSPTDLPDRDLTATVEAGDRPDVDAVVMSCADWPSRLLHDDLERPVGTLVVSNQATLHSVLAMIEPTGAVSDRGRLMSKRNGVGEPGDDVAPRRPLDAGLA